MQHFHSTRELAEILGCNEWQVRRLFEQGEIPEPPRFTGRRAIHRDLIPQIVDRLRAHGWLSCVEVASDAQPGRETLASRP